MESSASSHLDSNHPAIGGRLQCETNSGKEGSWSAGNNDVNQWLQVDLGSRYTKVTRVATQGKKDVAQWVTKYKLQYSNDGGNFQFYREEGQTVDKVKYKGQLSLKEPFVQPGREHFNYLPTIA